MALIFKSAGMNRKFSFFMREVACLCANIMPFSKSHQLLLGLAEFYQLDPDLGSFGLLSHRQRCLC
jgi:hypothetical protein